MKSAKSKRIGRVGRQAKWLAMAAMAACTAMGRNDAKAQQLAAENGPEVAPVQMPARRFKIAEGPLDAALALYGQQSGVTVKLDIPADKIATLKARAVVGFYSNEAALRQLLAESGLSFKFVDATTVSVGLKTTESVDVTSTLLDSSSMTKFTESLIDTPQTVVEIPAFVLKDEQNHTLMDAVRNVPGISLAAGEAGAQGDNLTIRGFTARNDIFLDGIRDFGSYYRDSFNLEQVEVLEGPAGVQFGRGSTGGVINQVSKTPAEDKFVNVNAQFGTDMTRRVTADINEPIADFAGGSALRINAMATEAGVAGRPFADNRRFGIAPSVSFGMNTPTRVTVSYFHFTESDTPDYGLPWFENGLAGGVNRHAYYGFADENFLRTNDDVMTLKANHTFPGNGDVDVHTIGRWANYPRNVQITEPQICSNAGYSVPVGGYVGAPGTSKAVATIITSAVNPNVLCPFVSGNYDPTQVVVNRNQLQNKSVEGDLWDQTEVTTRAHIHGIVNSFAGGVEGGREVSNPIRTNYNIVQTALGKTAANTVPSTSLLNPNTSQVFGGTGYVASITHVTSKSVGVYFVDTLKLGRFIELSGGARWDYFDTYFRLDDAPASQLPAGAAPTTVIAPLEQAISQPTYRAAIVFKPTKHGSVYFDYGTSFNPSAESLSLSVSSSLLPPEENETYEVGAKYSFFNDKLRTEGAWFHTVKDNARETDPTNSNNIVLAGNQLVQGVQASAVGRLSGGTDLVLGYAYLSSQVLYSQLFPTSIGYPLANVPKQTFNAFVTHNLPWHMSAGLGGNYVASRTASSTVPYVPTAYGPAVVYTTGTAPCTTTAPTLAAPITCYQVTSIAMKQVPGYWVFNAMVKRPITDKIELQANVYNLLNRFYIDQPHPSHLIPGAGLSALIGVNWKF
jgi:catecholate siderophore receptor